jgi:2-C-methyl-D-erythritol 2,4-cyclodiphosphate synthase
MRIGIGYDIHRLVKGRKLILGGVEIPHTHGLDGHSDADVVVHAVMDALLGAAALGDIGRHFPNTDPKYKGISSIELLKHVISLVTSHQSLVTNIDCMVIAEAPKLAPHTEKMRANIAKACGIKVSQVSIKATTNEGVGFIGRGEGIAAQAVVLLTKTN